MVGSVALVISGVTCVTPSGFPAGLALAADLMPPGDRHRCFGLLYSGVYITTATVMGGAMLLSRIFPGSEVALNVYLGVLSAAFFVVIWSIRLSSSGAAA